MELLEWCSACFKDDLVLKRVFLQLFVCVLDNNAELSYFLTGKTFSLQLQITWSLLLILVQFSEGNNAHAFRMSVCQFFHLNSYSFWISWTCTGSDWHPKQMMYLWVLWKPRLHKGMAITVSCSRRLGSPWWGRWGADPHWQYMRSRMVFRDGIFRTESSFGCE